MVCFSFLHTKVTLGGVGVADKVVTVAVGSPRYIRETISPDATHGDGVDAVIQELLSPAQDTAGQAEGDREEASDVLSVRMHQREESITALRLA